MTANLPVPLPDPDDRQENEARVQGGFWRKLRRYARRIPFAEEAVAAWYCTRDPQTPGHIRAAALAALAYFVIPTDALPDFLPTLGFADDAAMFWAVWQMIRKHVTDEHRGKAAQALDAENLRE
ncbi:MAG: YkvA family protein [Alphaproteobacteria bacterium]|nr:YkvA family protein [Alphaproteobacteria bacterium]